jgi:hypothetical protein
MRDRRVALAWAAFVVVALVSCVLVLQRDDRLSDLHIYYGALSDRSPPTVRAYSRGSGWWRRARRSSPSPGR